MRHMDSCYYYLYNGKGEMKNREFLRSFMIMYGMEVDEGRKSRQREKEKWEMEENASVYFKFAI